ncbi:MAG: hypothetical protein VB954_00110 [Thalassolituus sp.]|jgi:hypothetical protein|uniref:DNA-binding protein n=1 Tax=hydrothermal vent metagenome TaxID=652676 RepID=A0A160TC46_9ZZZZ|nr:hypothetical protein [Thalassolituus oleivorans]|tara:strand:+ start:1269 stop:1544 length:276 start_codon:yes stop_codon:yes gene_type:complete
MYIYIFYMESIVDRFLVLVIAEGVKMPWLAAQTNIEAKRWHTIKQRKGMRTSELEAVIAIWPEYAYWLTTGKEIPDSGQISPSTKQAMRRL